MSNKTFCDVCEDEIVDITGNAAREGGKISDSTIYHGKRINYTLIVSLENEWDCCYRCALRALMQGEGAVSERETPS